MNKFLYNREIKLFFTQNSRIFNKNLFLIKLIKNEYQEIFIQKTSMILDRVLKVLKCMNSTLFGYNYLK